MSSVEDEALLIPAYRREGELYAEALRIAEPLAAQLDSGADVIAELHQLATLMTEVAAIEASIAPAKAAFRTARRTPGPELRTALARVNELLQLLAGPVHAAEQSARTRHEQLVPELDTVARGLRMIRAYRQASRLSLPRRRS